MYQLIHYLSIAICCVCTLGMINAALKINISLIVQLLICNIGIYFIAMVFLSYCFGLSL